ncbi:MAG: glycosyltransferase [Clostridiales bacterium]|nr:glycosyltransferase [Clostridiales bacterium]
MPKRILVTASSFGHICSFHIPYLKALKDEGFEVDVACGGEMRNIPYADKLYQVTFEKKISSPKNFNAESALEKIIKENSYDLIITHTTLAAFFTRVALGGINPRPKVVDVMHGYLFDDETNALKKSVYVSAEKSMAKRTDLLLTMNSWDFNFAINNNLANKVGFINGMGLDLDKIDATDNSKRSEIREELNISDDAFLFVYAAEFSDRKNQSTLIKAMQYTDKNIYLVLPGRGDRIGDCKDLATNLNLRNRIKFPGQIEDMYNLYRACDAAVSSSRSEGLPFNIMEAFRFNLPVVASRVKGNTDLVEDGVTGLLCKYNDHKEFAHRMNEIYFEDSLAKTVSSNAFTLVEKYDIKKVLPEVMGQYLSVM